MARKIFAVGDRVKLSSATQQAMTGDRYATIERITKRDVWIKLEKSGDVIKSTPSHFTVMERGSDG